ncbi:hypothetical protein FGO68_gene15373 [Halteria grandinella]|uniref:Uncharacterized protein n=1 Tax=Halteria grandinella TaxID=5974 RepID=A0A8J8NEM3_HALGN|nr:hypothetical protein FGO68_gene15373 [Halteria grandinella]
MVCKYLSSWSSDLPLITTIDTQFASNCGLTHSIFQVMLEKITVVDAISKVEVSPHEHAQLFFRLDAGLYSEFSVLNQCDQVNQAKFGKYKKRVLTIMAPQSDLVIILFSAQPVAPTSHLDE